MNKYWFYNNYYFVNIFFLTLVIKTVLYGYISPMATANKQTGTTSFPWLTCEHAIKQRAYFHNGWHYFSPFLLIISYGYQIIIPYGLHLLAWWIHFFPRIIFSASKLYKIVYFYFKLYFSIIARLRTVS